MPTIPMQPNWIGILIAAFAVMMLGWVWFGVLFARLYAGLLGRDFVAGEKMPPLFIAGPSICMLMTTITSAFLMPALGVSTLPGAITFGLIIGIGYLGATAVNMGINPNIPRPLAYGFLSASYFLIASVLICIVLHVVG